MPVFLLFLLGSLPGATAKPILAVCTLFHADCLLPPTTSAHCCRLEAAVLVTLSLFVCSEARRWREWCSGGDDGRPELACTYACVVQRTQPSVEVTPVWVSPCSGQRLGVCVTGAVCACALGNQVIAPHFFHWFGAGRPNCAVLFYWLQQRHRQRAGSGNNRDAWHGSQCRHHMQ